MTILAVETVTRSGSLALWRDGRCEARAGEMTGTHGERLPLEVITWLAGQGRTLADVDQFAVVSGPGSFTGLRVGMAAVQGLAFATGRPAVAVPTLDALASTWQMTRPSAGLLVACLDGQRGDVFFAAWRPGPEPSVLESAAAVLAADVGTPAEAAARIAAVRQPGEAVTVVGSGGRRHPDAFLGLGDVTVVDPPAVLAEGAVRLAATWPDRAAPPHRLRPVYVRRPDAVLARERAGLAPVPHLGIVVEQATPGDIEAIEALQRETFTQPWDVGAIRSELDRAETARIYVAREADGRVAAFCACWIVVDELHINSLAVGAAWRRRGVATWLLREVFRDVRPAGVRAATLEVRASNTPARALYERLGFVVEGTRRDYYREPREDALVLWHRALA